MIEIDPEILNTFLAALTALILAIIAWYNRQRTVSAAITATATTQTATTNQAMATAAPVAPIAPMSMVPQPPGQPIPMYSTSYKMRDATREYLRLAIKDQADWESVTAQIVAAEAQNLSDYTLKWSHSRWCRIQFGVWMATNGQVTYISQVLGGAFDDSQI
jgi:hypothetical protein